MRAWMIAAATAVWIGVMIASIQCGMLNRFVAGASRAQSGLDFFQTPCGWQNLLAGNNIFLTEISSYSDITTSYFNHPLLAALVGVWTLPLPPRVAFWAFVFASLLLLLLCARLLSTLFSNPELRVFSYFAMFCSFPTYHMLWCGQMHVFVVVSIALVGCGLVRLQSSSNASASLCLIQIGVLLSLFSKPTALLFLPALLLLPETRKSTLLSVLLYSVASLTFLLTPRLNPGGYNAAHWAHLFQASLSPKQTIQLMAPVQVDESGSFFIYSLPRLLYGVLPFNAIRGLAVLHQAVIAILSFFILGIRSKLERLNLTLCIVALCSMSHFLCYFIAFEYQFAILTPTSLLLLWMVRQRDNKPRWPLVIALAGALSVFVPTLQWMSNEPNRFWFVDALLRVVPMEIAFVALVVFSICLLRRECDAAALLPSLKAAWKPVVVAIAAFAIVFDVAYATVPTRLLDPPSHWSKADWAEHFDDILSRPGVKPDAQFFLHRQLALIYADADQPLAMRHFELADKLTDRHDALAVDMAAAFASQHNAVQARKLLATVSIGQIKEPKVKQRYLELQKEMNQ